MIGTRTPGNARTVPEPHTWPVQQSTVRVGGTDVPLILPTRGDPRLIEIPALIVALAARILLVHQPLSALQIGVAVVTAVVLDMSLNYFRLHTVVLPVSALITALIIVLVLQSPAWWPFALAAAIGIVAKHAVRIDNHHVFNPSALGLAMVLLMFHGTAHAVTEHWEAATFITPIIVIGGALAMRQAGTVDVIPFFIPLYVILLLATSLIQSGPHPDSLKSVLTAAQHTFALFSIYLLTDPRTAPVPGNSRRIYAASTAVLGIALSLAGLDRMVALLVALLAANMLSAFVLRPRSALATRPYSGEPVSIPVDAPQEGAAAEHVTPRPSPANSVEKTMVLRRQQPVGPPYLVVTGSGARHALTGVDMTVGRAVDNDIRLESPGISRYHARLSVRQEGIWLLDLGSSNGTFVNGVRIAESVQLRNGDRIEFGGSRLGVEVDVYVPTSDASDGPR